MTCSTITKLPFSFPMDLLWMDEIRIIFGRNRFFTHWPEKYKCKQFEFARLLFRLRRNNERFRPAKKKYHKNWALIVFILWYCEKNTIFITISRKFNICKEHTLRSDFQVFFGIFFFSFLFSCCQSYYYKTSFCIIIL